MLRRPLEQYFAGSVDTEECTIDKAVLYYICFIGILQEWPSL